MTQNLATFSAAVYKKYISHVCFTKSGTIHWCKFYIQTIELLINNVVSVLIASGHNWIVQNRSGTPKLLRQVLFLFWIHWILSFLFWRSQPEKFVSERWRMSGFRKGSHVLVQTRVRGQLLRRRNRRMLVNAVQEQCHLHQSCRRVQLWLQEWLPGFRLRGEHRRLCTGSLSKRSNLLRPRRRLPMLLSVGHIRNVLRDQRRWLQTGLVLERRELHRPAQRLQVPLSVWVHGTQLRGWHRRMQVEPLFGRGIGSLHPEAEQFRMRLPQRMVGEKMREGVLHGEHVFERRTLLPGSGSFELRLWMGESVEHFLAKYKQ